MKSANVKVDAIHINLSPDLFHRWATHYYKCKQDFKSPDKFSPIPFFLLCRAIELETKSKHLITMTQEQAKEEFKHDIKTSYHSLKDEYKILKADDVIVLEAANEIYIKKEFEYFPDRRHALYGWSRFPDLEALDAVAKKLIEG